MRHLALAPTAFAFLFLVFVAVRTVVDHRQYERERVARREEQRRWWAQFGDACATDAVALRAVVEGCPRCTARLDAVLAEARNAHAATEAK